MTLCIVCIVLGLVRGSPRSASCVSSYVSDEQKTRKHTIPAQSATHHTTPHHSTPHHTTPPCHTSHNTKASRATPPPTPPHTEAHGTHANIVCRRLHDKYCEPRCIKCYSSRRRFAKFAQRSAADRSTKEKNRVEGVKGIKKRKRRNEKMKRSDRISKSGSMINSCSCNN